MRPFATSNISLPRWTSTFRLSPSNAAGMGIAAGSAAPVTGYTSPGSRHGVSSAERTISPWARTVPFRIAIFARGGRRDLSDVASTDAIRLMTDRPRRSTRPSMIGSERFTRNTAFPTSTGTSVSGRGFFPDHLLDFLSRLPAPVPQCLQRLGPLSGPTPAGLAC